MTEYFPHVRGGCTIYVGGHDTEITDVRFVLAFYGEDPEKVIEAFWREYRGDFVVVPLFGFGAVPRRELCSKESLTAALQSVTIEPGGFVEQKWKILCEQISVTWPERLTKAA